MVKGRRSLVSMCCSWPRQPLRVTKAVMMSTEPIVKQMANLPGASIITGRKRENASRRKTMPAPSSAKKYAYIDVDGIWTLGVQASQCQDKNEI